MKCIVTLLTEPSTKTADRVNELQDWLAPLKRVPHFTRDVSTVTELLKMVKQYSDEINDLPKGLVTVSTQSISFGLQLLYTKDNLIEG